MGQAPSIPGPAGPRGDPGPQGPPGEKGKDASGDPQQVASMLSSDPGFTARVVPIISKDNALGQTVAQQIATNQVSQNLLTNALVTNKTFANNVINSMALDPRFKGPQGQSGAAFDELSMQAALVPKSLWCADGEMCRIPATSPGTYLTGDTVIQRAKTLYLGGAAVGTSGILTIDTKHGVIVKDANPVDGPFIYGNKGGQLGIFDQANSTSGIPTLTWDANDVTVKGNIAQKGFQFQIGLGDTTRGDSAQSRAIVKDPGNILTINKGNDFINGTQVDSDLSVNTGKLKIGKWTIQNEGNDLKFLNKDNSEVLRIDNNGKIKNNKWFVESTDNALKFYKENSTGQFSFNDAYGQNNNFSLSDNYKLIDQEGLQLNDWKIMPTAGNLGFSATAGNKFTVQPDNQGTIRIGPKWQISAKDDNLDYDYYGNGVKATLSQNEYKHNTAIRANNVYVNDLKLTKDNDTQLNIMDGRYKLTSQGNARFLNGNWIMEANGNNYQIGKDGGQNTFKFNDQPATNSYFSVSDQYKLTDNDGLQLGDWNFKQGADLTISKSTGSKPTITFNGGGDTDVNFPGSVNAGNDVNVKNNINIGGWKIGVDSTNGHMGFAYQTQGNKILVQPDNQGTIRVGPKWQITSKDDKLVYDYFGQGDKFAMENNGNLNFTNGWRIRNDSNWFNVDKDNVWKTAVQNTGLFQARDIVSDKNVNVNGIVLSNDNSWLSSGGYGYKTTGDINATNISSSNDVKTSNLYIGNIKIQNPSNNLTIYNKDGGEILHVNKDGWASSFQQGWFVGQKRYYVAKVQARGDDRCLDEGQGGWGNCNGGSYQKLYFQEKGT